METICTYGINGNEFELYKAASGDYCVTLTEPGKESENYNLGTKEKAYEFILSYARYEEE